MVPAYRQLQVTAKAHAQGKSAIFTKVSYLRIIWGCSGKGAARNSCAVDENFFPRQDFNIGPLPEDQEPGLPAARPSQPSIYGG